MGIGDKYTSFCGSNCCSSDVQTAPQPCCESHTTICMTGICFYTTCDFVATSGEFYLTFKNTYQSMLPMNANEVFLYHQAAGAMRIKGFNGVSYIVELVDSTRAGAVIQTTDCVALYIHVDALDTVSTNAKCLVGTFIAPALNADAEIIILNGTSIPIGSTITFTYNGETGSYLVKAFVTADGNNYAYTVTNTGGGHTPGTIITAACEGVCDIPIEVLTDIDLCDLAESETLDTITGCLNGTPRGMTPVGDGYIPVGEDGNWTQQKVVGLDCCVILDDCVSFSGTTCPNNTGQVVLRDVNIECFEAAYDNAILYGQVLPVNIEGYNFVVVDYDSGTRTVTLQLAEDTTLSTPISFCNNEQMCIGECCESCLIGPQFINPAIISEDREEATVFNIVDVVISAPAGVSRWLIGIDQAGADDSLLLDAAYFANPADTGPRLPKIEDPLVVRQKICNTSPDGCNQMCRLDYNFEFTIDGMVASTVVDWQLQSYVGPSDTLSDGTTPNPFTDISVQCPCSGRIFGASETDSVMENTLLGPSGTVNPKIFPVTAQVFNDEFILNKCDCGMSIVWFFLRVTNGEQDAISLTIDLDFRRRMKKFDLKLIDAPLNDANAEGWSV